MQAIFDENKILRCESERTNFVLFESICEHFLDIIEDIFFIYNINPTEILDLKPQNHYLAQILNPKGIKVFTDIEKFEKWNFIASILNLHKTNNIIKSLTKIKDILNVNGLFIGTFFGLNNLQKLGELLAQEDIKIIGRTLPRMLPLTDIKTVGTMLTSAGFKNTVIQSVQFVYSFQTLKEALIFLKQMGETNCFKARDDTLLGGNVLKKILANHGALITLEFEVYLFSCLG